MREWVGRNGPCGCAGDSPKQIERDDEFDRRRGDLKLCQNSDRENCTRGELRGGRSPLVTQCDCSGLFLCHRGGKKGGPLPPGGGSIRVNLWSENGSAARRRGGPFRFERSSLRELTGRACARPRRRKEGEQMGDEVVTPKSVADQPASSTVTNPAYLRSV
jgi:hypothetical protein